MGMISHLVWACLACQKEAALAREDKIEVCRACRTRYQRGEGATVVVEPPDADRRVLTAPEIEDLLPPPGSTGVTRCEVRDPAGNRRLYALGIYLGRIDQLGKPRPGTLTLADGRLRFEAEVGLGFDLPVSDIHSIQLSEHALQLKVKGQPVFSVKPIGSSPKLWEERLRNAVAEDYERRELGEIAEYQPRVCVRRGKQRGASSFRFGPLLRAASKLNPLPPWQYRLCCWIARTGWKFFGGIDVQGLENVPRAGPFLLICNHQSFIEPVLVPAVLPRTIHAMAKTTQFKVPIAGWIMARIFAFPVRRFEIDPHAMRYTLRRLSQGYGILIFIEGERSWNGELQQPRLGVGRLALKAGVPVIPCRVDGAYESWPRWARRPQKRRVRIAFGPPVDLPVVSTRQECEDCLEEAVGRIMRALAPFRHNQPTRTPATR